ncbi:MAG: hypothetical protein ACP5GX_09445, partial [Anaerolineae bacterium]
MKDKTTSSLTNPWGQLVLLAGLLALVLACTPAVLLPTATPTATLTPTPPPTLTPLPLPTATPTDTGWQPVAPGMESRALTAPTERGPERVQIVRLNPAQFDIKVRHQPGYATPVSDWAAQTGALLTTNAGYFTEEGNVTGLTISEGEVYGIPYGDYAGMLAVTPEGEMSLRWLR